jgi:hypothetical protein
MADTRTLPVRGRAKAEKQLGGNDAAAHPATPSTKLNSQLFSYSREPHDSQYTQSHYLST